MLITNVFIGGVALFDRILNKKEIRVKRLDNDNRYSGGGKNGISGDGLYH